MNLHILDRRPELGALAGAVAIAFSGIHFRYADVSPRRAPSSAVLYALPALAVSASSRTAGSGPDAARAVRLPRGRLLRGRPRALAPLDRLRGRRARHGARQHAGAHGRAARVGAVERAAVEPPLTSIPLAFGGVVLISGVLEEGAYGENPGLGVVLGIFTGIAYSGFLLALRQGPSGNRAAGPLFDATLASAVLRPDDRSRRRRLRPVPGLGRRAGLSCWR